MWGILKHIGSYKYDLSIRIVIISIFNYFERFYNVAKKKIYFRYLFFDFTVFSTYPDNGEFKALKLYNLLL